MNAALRPGPFFFPSPSPSNAGLRSTQLSWRVYVSIYTDYSLLGKPTSSEGVNWSDASDTNTTSESAVNKENRRETRPGHWSLVLEHTVFALTTQTHYSIAKTFYVKADIPTIFEPNTELTESTYGRASSNWSPSLPQASTRPIDLTDSVRKGGGRRMHPRATQTCHRLHAGRVRRPSRDEASRRGWRC